MNAPLIEAIRKDPHWQVRLRPIEHDAHRVKTLAECWKILETNKVSLRGWPYPCMPTQGDERENAGNYIGAWCDWRGHREYWRFYQSTQFFHLLSVIESTDPEYAQIFAARTKEAMRHYGDKALESVRGYVGFLDLLFTVTQIFEFAVRLSLRGVFDGGVRIEIGLRNVKDFMLANADPMRSWHHMHFCRQGALEHPSISTTTADLIGAHPEMALDASRWFYERFDWHDPSLEVLRADQARLLSGFRR